MDACIDETDIASELNNPQRNKKQTMSNALICRQSICMQGRSQDML